MTAAPGHIVTLGTPVRLDPAQPGGGVGVSIECMENVFTESLK